MDSFVADAGVPKSRSASTTAQKICASLRLGRSFERAIPPGSPQSPASPGFSSSACSGELDSKGIATSFALR
jgi:hypothetical protein